MSNHNTSILHVISLNYDSNINIQTPDFFTRVVSWDRLDESHLMSQLNIVPNDSHEEYGQLAARTSGHYLSGRLCHNDSALLL